MLRLRLAPPVLAAVFATISPCVAAAVGLDSGLTKAQLEKRDAYVARVLADLKKRPDPPASEDAIELLLWDYQANRDGASLRLAESLALKAAGASGDRVAASAWACYRTALSGGRTFAEGDRLLESTRTLLAAGDKRATTDTYARLVQDLFARAAILSSDDAYLEALMGMDAVLLGRVVETDTRAEVVPGGSEADFTTLSDHIECLDMAVLAYEASGARQAQKTATLLAHELLRRHWDETAGRLRMDDRETVGMPPSVKPLLNARAAIALWRAGQAAAEPLLAGRAQRVLDGVLDEAGASPESAAAAALAAAILSRPPLLVVVVGNPGDDTAIVMRRAAFSVPHPGRVVLILDPAQQDPRQDELPVSVGAGPAMVLLQGDAASPAIVDPNRLVPEYEALLAQRRGGGK